MSMDRTAIGTRYSSSPWPTNVRFPPLFSTKRPFRRHFPVYRDRRLSLWRRVEPHRAKYRGKSPATATVKKPAARHSSVPLQPRSVGRGHNVHDPWMRWKGMCYDEQGFTTSHRFLHHDRDCRGRMPRRVRSVAHGFHQRLRRPGARALHGQAELAIAPGSVRTAGAGH